MKTDAGPLDGRKTASAGRSVPSIASHSPPPSSLPAPSSSPHRLRPLLLLLFVSLVSRVNGQDSFYFKIKPKDHDVEEGKPVRLRCQVSNNRHIRYHWTLNSIPLVLDTRRTQDGSDLHIRKADPDLDSGKFRCVASNVTSGYSLQSGTASINVFWLSPNVTASLVEPSRMENIVLGGPLELRCATSAHPNVAASQISWFQNYQKLKRKTAVEKGVELQSNGNLRIQQIKAGNVGIYRCFVHHPAGRVMSKPFPLTFGGDGKYNTSNKPEDYLKYVKKGEEMRLICQAFNYSNGRVHFVRWSFRPSMDNTDSKVYNIESDEKCDNQPSRRLCILNAANLHGLLRRKVRKRSEVGFYKCDPMPWQSKPSVIEVRLATNPRLLPNSLYPMSKRNKPLVVVLGSNLTIRLYQDLTRNMKTSVVPDPPPQYNWFRPGSKTPVPEYSSLRRYRIYKLKGRNLHFKNVEEGDSGIYSLWISNLAGVQKINVSVVVAFHPKFLLTELPPVRVEEGKDTEFRCNLDKMSQYPVARVIWFKNQQRIPISGRLVEDQRSGVLSIRGVTISDEGIYQCAVDTMKIEPNLVHSNKFNFRVKRTLKILNPPKKQFLERGSTARIPCVAQGDGEVYITWKRNQRTIPALPRASGYVGVERNDLVFQKVLDEHNGKYVCLATNRLQGVVNNTVQVIVGERPKIVFISKNLTVTEGKSVMLNCEATGDPRPTISWIKKVTNSPDSKAESITKDNYAVVSPMDRRVMLSNGSLLIRRAVISDAAHYCCVAGNTYAMNSEKEVYLRVISKGMSETSGRDSNWSMTKTVIIVVGCAVAYLALIIGLTIYCSVRMLRNRQKRAAWAVAKMEGGAPGGPAHENGRLMAMPNGESQGLMSAPDGGPGPGHGDSRSHFSSASAYTRSLRAGTPNSSLQERMSTYPRHQLQTLGMLGKGEFGDVFLARAHNIREGESESLVVIKSHHNGHSDALDYEFHQQMDMFAKLDHDFVVKLLGVCREVEPEFMILEYCEWGDLKQFLKAMRQSDKESNERNVKIPPLTASQKVTMCSQVALGMEHLSNYRYVHKDLAARNVLLTSTLDLKIANLGLCQDVYAGEYFPMRNKRLPLRWLPSEVILEDAYSTKSDVWAFGVLVYEVFTLGDIPHRRLTDLQVINAAESHYLMPELPAQCPAELASLLRQCWSDKPRERPSFNDISVIIGELTVDSDI